MAKGKQSADELLANLLGNLDKGIMSAKKVKPKVVKVQDEAVKTRSFHKPSLEAKRIVLLVHRNTCKCGDVECMSNRWPLVEKIDKWGNLHRTRFMTVDDIEGLPRTLEYIDYEVSACASCFDLTENLEPELSDEAKKLEAVSDDAAVDALFARLNLTTENKKGEQDGE